MTDYRFDTDTAGRLINDTTVEVNLNADWNVDGTILNGGYLHAVVARAAAIALPGLGSPIAISTSFVATANPGPAAVDVHVLRTGSRISAVNAALRQDGHTVVTCLLTMATADPPAAKTQDDVSSERASFGPEMPEVTPAAQSIRLPSHQLPGPPGLAELIDYAFVPESSAWLSGDTSAGPRIRVWLAFSDGRPVDALAAIALVDIAPPVCFALGKFGWAPTLQLQVGLFAAPAPGPVLLDLVGAPYDGAVVAEDGLLWDSRGALIARSRQIALAPRT